MGGQLQRGACDTSGDRADYLRWHVPVGMSPRATEDRLALLCTSSSAFSRGFNYIYVPHLLRAVSARQAWTKFRRAFVTIPSTWNQHQTWSLMLILGLGSESGTQVIELRSQLPQLR